MDTFKSLTVTVEPAEEPLTLAEAKLHLRVDGTDEDALISTLIVAARRLAEARTGRKLVTQTLELSLDAFPSGAIDLRVPNVSAINSVKYVDTDGTLQTLNASLYDLDSRAVPCVLYPAYSTTWPSTRDVANTVIINMDAGFGAAADVPETIKAWMLLAIGSLYSQREGHATTSVTELPRTYFDGLLDAYRLLGF